MDLTCDIVRQAIDQWLKAHPQFRYTKWTLEERDRVNGRYAHRQTHVEGPPGTLPSDVGVYFGRAHFRLGGTGASVRFYGRRLGPTGVAKDRAQSAARVIRFLEDLAGGWVAVRHMWTDRSRPQPWVFRASRHGWHRVGRFKRRKQRSELLILKGWAIRLCAALRRWVMKPLDGGS